MHVARQNRLVVRQAQGASTMRKRKGFRMDHLFVRVDRFVCRLCGAEGPRVLPLLIVELVVAIDAFASQHQACGPVSRSRKSS